MFPTEARSILEMSRRDCRRSETAPGATLLGGPRGANLQHMSISIDPNSRRAQIASLAGDEAADFACRSVVWLRWGGAGIVVGLVLIWIEAITKQSALWIGVAAGAAVAIGCAVPGLALDRRAGVAASTYLSARIGHPVRVKSGGMRLAAWRREIDRAGSDSS